MGTSVCFECGGKKSFRLRFFRPFESVGEAGVVFPFFEVGAGVFIEIDVFLTGSLQPR